MKILVLTTAYEPLTGGAELAVKYIVENLPEHEFTILTAKQKKGLQSFEDKGHIKIHRLGLGYGFDRHLFIVLAPLFFCLRLTTYDLRLSWAMMANQSGYAALTIKKLFGLKYLLSLQEGDSEAWFAKREKFFLYKHIYTQADRIQAISNFLITRSKKYGLKTEPVLVANGYDGSIFKPASESEKQKLREEFKIPKNVLVLVTASRLVEKNGIDLAIKSLEKVSDTVLYIAGTGPLEAELKSLTKTLGLEERVMFLGNLQHAQLVALMQASDVFIRLSRSEGLGSVFLEAGAVGLPIIATNVGGIPDVVIDGKNGTLVESENILLAAEAIQNLQNTAVRERMSQEALIFTKNFTWKHIARQMSDIFSV